MKKQDDRKIIDNLKDEIEHLFNKCRQLEDLLDVLPGDVYWKNLEGVWLGLNQRCLKSLSEMGFVKGASKTEVIGKTDFDLFDDVTANGYRINDLMVIEKKIEISIEENTLLPTGEKIVLLSTKRSLLNQGKIIGIILF